MKEVHESRKLEIKKFIEKRTDDELAKLLMLLFERTMHILEEMEAFELIRKIEALKKKATKLNVSAKEENNLIEFLYNLQKEEMVAAINYTSEELEKLKEG